MPRPDGAMRVRVVLDAAPPAMADEARLIARGLPGWREEALAQGTPLTAACDDTSGVAIRPLLGRSQFGSNADERNLLFIYETSVVVGIPVTLICLAAWSWSGETTVEGRLETVACDGSRAPNTLVESLRLRSEGRGLIRSARLKSEQTEGAVRGLTRKLLGAAIAEAAGTQGGR